jgi:uncharacterized protein (TIGR00255 family)
MIVSMTGFGDATAERDGTHYAVEIRSLNNRFFKPVIKLPDNVSGLEPELESLLREALGRGSITYILKMRTDSADAAYHINTQALKSYLAQLQEIKGLDRLVQIDLASLVQLPGVCQEPRDETDEIEKHGPVVRELSKKAIVKLNAMREREGQSLFNELMKHVKVIADSLAAISERAPSVIEDYHKRLTQRVNQLMSKAELRVNESDLIKEVAVFAERADIAEEIQRLTHHLKAFEDACRESEHSGRKLDFITQEMLREANTIASKANDATITRHTVEIKGAIDRLKEQVQNVE